MEELLGAILYGIVELFGEVIVELLLEAVCSLFVRMIRGVFEEWMAQAQLLLLLDI